jgi:hypothetical protein
MDPDFFEVVMGADGTLKCFPVTEQAHAEVTISSEKRARVASRYRHYCPSISFAIGWRRGYRSSPIGATRKLRSPP